MAALGPLARSLLHHVTTPSPARNTTATMGSSAIANPFQSARRPGSQSPSKVTGTLESPRGDGPLRSSKRSRGSGRSRRQAVPDDLPAMANGFNKSSIGPGTEHAHE